MSEPTVTELIMFLVERYGYARRDGEHQGKGSAAWFQEIEQRVTALVAALREAIPRLCEGCNLMLPSAISDSRGNDVDGTHAYPRGGVTSCGAIQQREALRAAGEAK